MNILEQLETDGVAILPNFIQGEQLANMRRAFESRLKRLRWNDVDGLTKDRTFSAHGAGCSDPRSGICGCGPRPVIKDVLRSYLGDRFRVSRGQGLEIPSHAARIPWLARRRLVRPATGPPHPPRGEARLLPDRREVRRFNYIKGTHGKQAPRPFAAT